MPSEDPSVGWGGGRWHCTPAALALDPALPQGLEQPGVSWAPALCATLGTALQAGLWLRVLAAAWEPVACSGSKWRPAPLTQGLESQLYWVLT